MPRLPDEPSLQVVIAKDSPLIIAYNVPNSSRSSSIPAAPSLYAHCMNAIEGMDVKPVWFERCGFLGKIQLLAPSAENGAYMTQFALPKGHMCQPVGELGEPAPEGIITVPVTAEVADCIINSGSLTALDAIAWGRLEDGVLEEIILYIETDE